jgi:hypothetical protein
MDSVALSCELLPADKRQLSSSDAEKEAIDVLQCQKRPNTVSKETYTLSKEAIERLPDEDKESFDISGVMGGGGVLEGVGAKRLTPEWDHGQTVTGYFFNFFLYCLTLEWT